MIATIAPSSSPDLAPQVLPPYRIPFPGAANMMLHFGNLDKSIRKYHASGKVSLDHKRFPGPVQSR